MWCATWEWLGYYYILKYYMFGTFSLWPLHDLVSTSCIIMHFVMFIRHSTVAGLTVHTKLKPGKVIYCIVHFVKLPNVGNYECVFVWMRDILKYVQRKSCMHVSECKNEWALEWGGGVNSVYEMRLVVNLCERFVCEAIHAFNAKRTSKIQMY